MTIVPDERFERCDLLVYSESLSNKQKAASPQKKGLKTNFVCHRALTCSYSFFLAHRSTGSTLMQLTQRTGCTYTVAVAK